MAASEGTTGTGLTTVNLISGLSLIAIGLFAIFWLIPSYVSVEDGMSTGLSPAFLPKLAAAAMALLGLSIVVSSARHLSSMDGGPQEESEENEELAFGRPEIVNLCLLAVVSVVFMLLFVYGGFVASCALLLAFAMYATGVRNVIPLVAIAVCFPVLLEQILWHALVIPLPSFWRIP